MSLLFRPIRLILLCAAAFVAGVLYERGQSGTDCASLGQSCSEEHAHG